jgi:hypothetical protein
VSGAVRSGRPPSAVTGSEVAGRAWTASTAYKAGDLVTQAGTLYRANTDFTSGATFNATNWTAVTTGAAVAVPVVAGNLGSAYTLDMQGKDEVRLFGTLSASPLAITTTGWKTGVSRAELVLLKTAGTARTVTIDGTSIPVLTSAASVVVVLDTSDGGVTVVASVPGSDGPQGPGGPPGPGGPAIGAGRYWVNGPGLSNANPTAAADQLILSPIEVPLDCTLDRIGIWVAVAGSAGALVRLGIYAYNGGFPGALLLDAGTVDVTSIGFKSATISLAVTAGFYFAGAVQQGAPTTRAGLDGLANNVPQRGATVATPFSGSNPGGYGQTSVPGALPNPFAGIEATNSSQPRIYLRHS